MTNLGQYTLHEELGRGSYSIVYRATHAALGNQVAIKILLPELSKNENAKQRFSQEAQTASVLAHPNIVSILDLDEDNGQFFIVSEYVEGDDLKKRFSNSGILAQKDFLRILHQTAEALDYAHLNKILHKDVKPGNVLIASDGSAHICDFGLVDVIQAAKLGSLIGNASYTSPEQAEGKILDGRSDQYSLAVIAYELLTGELPFKGDNSTATALLHITKQPPNPCAINPKLSTEVADVLLKALEKEPNKRFTNCCEFIVALTVTLEDSQLRQYRELISEARNFLENGKAIDAKSRIESARKIMVDRPDLNDALSELESASLAAENYEKVISNWQLANQEARAILDIFPNYPDPDEIFSFLGLRKAGWAIPDPRELLLQVGVGIILGLPLLGLIIYLTFLWIVR
ncbi:MAG: serine/threonine-protein kinase [Chloroflexota bacterium]